MNIPKGQPKYERSERRKRQTTMKMVDFTFPVHVLLLCLFRLQVSTTTQAFSIDRLRSTGAFNTRRSSRSLLRASTAHTNINKKYHHALAILNMPLNSRDRIANEAVLETVLPMVANKLSLVLRTPTATTTTISTAQLRRYVGEMYSQLWDLTLGTQSADLPHVVIYPQNLPNAAPESWITIQPDLDVVCSCEDTVGWISTSTTPSRGLQFRDTNGAGGLEKHVTNINLERARRQLQPVQALPVRGQHQSHDSEWVVFVDDDEEDDMTAQATASSASGASLMLAGAEPDPQHVYNSVCVGGTFDGLHFGHCKLLTLAMSSVTPVTGRLYVGVTQDKMLKNKAYAEFIPPCAERIATVREFLYRFAPGMRDRIQVRPIEDAFGAAGRTDEHFDALVLSHETLYNGHKLNEYRQNVLQIEPLKLLCTRRTEAQGMSSTTLRKLRSEQQQQQQATKVVGQ